MTQRYIEQAPDGEKTSPAGTEVLPVTDGTSDWYIKIANLIIEKIRDGIGTVLTIGTIADGKVLKRSGASIVSGETTSIQESGSSTVLSIGTVADGKVLKRSGTSVIGGETTAIQESGASTVLSIGSVSDGKVLKRSGTSVIGGETTTLQESGGPTVLSIGSVADDMFLQRSGSTIVGGYSHAYTRYKISPSVSSNNLTVAITHMDGTTPTSSSPLKFRIGDAEYSITSSTSFTKNAGTNWMDMGSSELAANDVDLFLYAIAETGAAAGIKFGYSRIPYALTMGDFVNTATDQKYIAGSWTNFNSSDSVAVIGRFRAQLSAGASYNWSIPNSKVVNRPIYETDWLVWTPQYTGYSANPTHASRYKVSWSAVHWTMNATGVGTSNATTATVTLPFTLPSAMNHWCFGRGVNNGTEAFVLFRMNLNSKTMDSFPGSGPATAWTNVGQKYASGQGFFLL